MTDRAREAAQNAVWRLLEDALGAVDGQDDADLAEALEKVGPDAAEDWAPGGFRTQTTAESAVRGALGAAVADELVGDDETVHLGDSYLMFVAVLDSSTTILCSDLGEPPVVLPASHAFWQTHSPPMHFGCRSMLVGLSAEEAAAVGITSSPPDVDGDEGFGSPGAYQGFEAVESDFEVATGPGPRGGAAVEWGE